MGKIKIVYDRESCIGAAACVIVDSDLWRIEEDNKANLLGGKYNEETKKWEIFIDRKDLDEEKLEKIKEAAEVCPVDVIEVYDEKGERIA